MKNKASLNPSEAFAMKKAKGKPSVEDQLLFQEWTKDVRPLRKSQNKVDLPPVRKRKPHQQTRQMEAEKTTNWSDLHYEEHFLAAESRNLNQRNGVQQRTIKKLKQGRIPIEATLDLHGCNVEQARHLLSTTLQQCQQQAIRCLCVIHGKGSRNPEGKAILKSMVHHWLKQADEVLALCSAQARHGGTGAVYVLLKRLK